jgi:hypothetical protein
MLVQTAEFGQEPTFRITADYQYGKASLEDDSENG